MASETERGCGFRQVGGLYFVTEPIQFSSCDRPLIELKPCSCCGHVPVFIRGIQQINPRGVLWTHEKCGGDCTLVDCIMCKPENMLGHGLMWVGKSFYKDPNTFISEVERLGLSKRISALPSWYKAGKTILYLAMEELLPNPLNYHPTRTRKLKKKPAVFAAVRLSKVELILNDSQRSDKALMKELKDKGISPVFVPDNDPDHHTKPKKIKAKNPKPKTRSMDEFF